MAYKRLMDSKSSTMATIRLIGATVAQAKHEGMNKMHQLFLACLNDHLCDKVLEARKDTFAQSLELTRELEAIQLDHKPSQKIATIKTELQSEEANAIVWEHLTEEKIEQEAHNNCYPPKKNFGRQACPVLQASLQQCAGQKQRPQEPKHHLPLLPEKGAHAKRVLWQCRDGRRQWQKVWEQLCQQCG